MKRRAAIIAIATGLAAVGGSLAAEASAAPLTFGRDSSGCVVLLYDTANPVTFCLFPR